MIFRTNLKFAAQAKRNFWITLANTPKLVHLVWKAAPIWVLAVTATTMMSSLLPIGWLYVNKLILDWITVNIGQSSINWQPLIVLIAIRFILSSGKTGLSQLITHFSQVLGNRFTLYITRKILEKSLQLDLSHYESSEFHTVLSRAQQSGANYPVKSIGTLTNLLSQAITLSGLLLLLISFNPILGLILLMTSVPMLRLGAGFSNRKFSLNHKQTFNGRLSSYFQRLVTHQDFAKEVRVFNLGSYLINRWYKLFQLTNEEIDQLSLKHLRARIGFGLLPNLGLYTAYLFVLMKVVKGDITIGDFTMYAAAFSQAQSLLDGLTQNVSATYEANLFITQYYEFMNLQPKIFNPRRPLPFPRPITQDLILDNVSFQYPHGSKPVLRNLNLKVYPGESIALVGVNGAGKTTLINLLMRLYEPSAGQIMIDGIPLDAFELKQLRQNITVLFQDFARYNLSIQENVGFGDVEALDDRQRIEKAIFSAGASELVKTLKNGYQTNLGPLFPDGENLSGGQWQKIGLARAFMSQAQILILDEPTAAMDAIAEFELFKKFRSLTQGKITFFISHRFSSVRIADRIVVLNNGEFAEIGTHHELLKLGGLYAEMFHLQAAGYQTESAS